MQSLPADSTGGRGCRQPFVFSTPALPLSLQPHLTSFVYLCLSPFSGCTFSLLATSHPPIETKLSRSRLSHTVSGKDLYISYLFTFHLTWRTLLTDTALSVSSHPPQPLNALVVCLFVFAIELQLLFHIFFSWIFRLIFFPPSSICLLPPHQMFSNGGKQVKTPQQNATRETISARSGEITVAGSGHWKLQRQNRGVLSFSFFFALGGSECSELIVIKMESVTPL